VTALLQSLRDVFSNPTNSFTATAIVVAIVVVLVLAVALVLIAIALPSQSRRRTPEARKAKGSLGNAEAARRRPLSPKGCVALAGLLTVGLVISTAVWYESTSTNRYCTSVCHEMAAPAASWRTSTHSNVPCVRCHEGQRWRSMPVAVVSRTRSLLLEITGAKPRKHRKVPSSLCLECHALVMEQTLTGLNGETFTHREFPATKTCGDCHGAQGHLVHGADEAAPTP
jgi:nitrate/TMAO reductase-like tetraheme cytochrome c subunit